MIHDPTIKGHLVALEAVFIRMRKWGLKIKPSKCSFFAKKVTFLGHVLSEKGKEPDPRNVDKLKNAPAPTNVKEVQRVLGLGNYYRKFIKGYAELVKPMQLLVNKDRGFLWEKEQEESFQALKVKLTTAPVLIHPDFEKPFVLATDASGYAAGAVLSQYDDQGKDHPIAYYSKKFTNCQKKYTVTEREAYAIVLAMEHFRQLILGHEVIISTDHKPLVWLGNHKDTNDRLSRWAMRLQKYSPNIRFRSGSANANADFMSRIPENTSGIVNLLYTCRTDPLDLLEAQLNDEEIKLIKEAMNGTAIAQIECENDMKKHLNRHLFRYKMDGEYLMAHFNEGYRIVIPKSLRNHLLQQYHSGPLGGHLSARKIQNRLHQKYFWPFMKREIIEYINNCDICNSRRGTGTKIKVPLQPIPVPSSPMETIAMDVIGPLPETSKGNKYILMVTDLLTKYCEAFDMPDQKTTTVATININNICCRYGTPKRLLTDQGTNFMSGLFKEINEQMAVKQIRTTPYHPQCDGQTERANQTAINII